MSDFRCPECGCTDEPSDELTGRYCAGCGARVDTTSDEVLNEVKDNHDYLGED